MAKNITDKDKELRDQFVSKVIEEIKEDMKDKSRGYRQIMLCDLTEKIQVLIEDLYVETFGGR